MAKAKTKTSGHTRLLRQKAGPDFVLAGLAAGLTLLGLLAIYDASVVEAYRTFADKLYFLKLQAQWALVGVAAAVGTYFFPYPRLRPLAPPLLLAAIVLLVLVLIPGVGVEALGARRRIDLGPIGVQPAEFAKLAFIIYLAAFLSAKKDSIWPLWLATAIIFGLIVLEPDLGTAVVLLGSAFTVYFVSGAPLLTLLILAIIGVLAGAGVIFVSPYRKERLLTFLDPARDPLGASYHIRQILIALGSGGLFGLGLGQSRQKFQYLPEVTTDSIFAVIAEEVGFVGAVTLILLFLLLIYRGFHIARSCPDSFGRLLATGIVSLIGFQALVNLAAMVALVPLTGVPLPFISYGGSSLVVTLAGIGILLNISKSGATADARK